MSASSSSSRSLARQQGAPVAPFIPLVPYPNCGRLVNMCISGTKQHTGWVFYQCKNHGMTCNLWHWEHEYVYHLFDINVLRGEACVEAVGWAEERREELERALWEKKLAEEWGKGSGDCIGATSSMVNVDDIFRRELLVLGREMLLMFKIGVLLRCCVMVAAVGIFLNK
uniref:Uncharacterized protein n=1 Tax=Avena sativa TaxID=4498 RepID=A0ACD5ZZG8_AVESA